MAKSKIEISERMSAALAVSAPDQKTQVIKRARAVFDEALSSTSVFEEALAQVYLQGMVDLEGGPRKRGRRSAAPKSNGPGTHSMAENADERHHT